jgi:hypothetical protein
MKSAGVTEKDTQAIETIETRPLVRELERVRDAPSRSS